MTNDTHHNERDAVVAGPSSSTTGTATGTAVFGVAECSRGRTREDGGRGTAAVEAGAGGSGDKKAALRMGTSYLIQSFNPWHKPDYCNLSYLHARDTFG